LAPLAKTWRRWQKPGAAPGEKTKEKAKKKREPEGSR
jgi:hypothetical protein